MQNIANTAYLPQNYVCTAQYPLNNTQPQANIQGNQNGQNYGAPQSTPAPSVGAVNIQIYNPTANPAGMAQPIPYPVYYPINYTNPIQPSPYQMPQGADWNHGMNMNSSMNNIASQADGAKGEKTEKKDEKKNKPKVALTDDYIKTLENYLSAPDKKIRLMGAKELLERFKEDETRKDDAALTALLNKTLQDPTETVKFVGLAALDSGYATGNDETAQILTQIQNSNTSFGEDATLATQILLKMSGYKANADAKAYAEQNKTQPTQTNMIQNNISANAFDNATNQYMMNTNGNVQNTPIQQNGLGGSINV